MTSKVVPKRGFGGDEDVASGLTDDSVGGREAEAGPLTDVLGREERLEDARQRALRHAFAGVADGDPAVAAVCDRGMPWVESRRREPVDRERERAAVGHCIAGVEREIEQDLVDLGRVGDDRRRIVVHPKVGSDRGRQNTAKQRGGATQEAGRRDFLDGEFMLAAEG